MVRLCRLCGPWVRDAAVLQYMSTRFITSISGTVWHHRPASWQPHFTADLPPPPRSCTTTRSSQHPGYSSRLTISHILSSILTWRQWQIHLVTTITSHTSQRGRRQTDSIWTPSASSVVTRAPVNTTACWRARDARASSNVQFVATSRTRAAAAATVPSINIIAINVNTVDSRNVSRSACDERVSIQRHSSHVVCHVT